MSWSAKHVLSWICVTAFIVCTSGQDCANYEMVSDERRSTQKVLDPMSEIPLCDVDIDGSKWYRFRSHVGEKIPERDPPGTVDMNRCGTEAPIYIKGSDSHPTADGVTFPAVACANNGQGGDNCNWEGAIKIHKCPPNGNEASFYIYQLAKPPGCSYAYCAGEGPPCAQGEMWNGSYCVDSFPVMSGFPTLTGPHTRGNGTGKQVYFSCVIHYESVSGNDNARFTVTFLFDDDPMEILQRPFKNLLPFTVDPNNMNLTVELEEEYLRGRLGKEIRCQAVSYWLGYNTHSEALLSQERYLAGIASSKSSYDFDLSKGTMFPIVFTPSLPLTCAHCDIYGCQCLYRFRVRTNDLAKQCAMVWDETGNPLQIQVHVVPTGVNEELNFQVHWQEYTDDGLQQNSSLWHGYVIQAAQIHVYSSGNSEPPYQICSSVSDPHISTFDKYKFNNYLTGDFVLASAVDLAADHHMEVQVRHEVCNGGQVTCNCGVVVRERNSVYKISYCEDGGWQSSTQRHVTAVQLLKQSPHDGSQLFRDASGTKFSIHMPSGLRVEVDAAKPWFDIYVHLPPEYHDKTSEFSFCGNSNGNSNDDSISDANNFRIPTTTQNYFAEQPSCSTLFYPAAMNCTCYNSSVVECSNENEEIAKTSLATIPEPNPSTSGIICYSPETAGVQLESADEIDPDLILDPTELFSSPEFDPNFGTNVSFNWPTPSGKTEADVEDYCSNVLRKSPAYDHCSVLGDADNLISQCKIDVQVADEYIDMSGYARQMDQRCTNNLVAANDTDTLDAVYNSVCPNYCSGNGTCANAICTCNEGFIGADCSIDGTLPPTLSGIVRDGLCDTQAKPCNTISVYGSNIASEGTLKCRFQDRVTGVIVEKPGTFITSSEVRCSIDSSSHSRRRKRAADDIKAVNRKYVSLANDGILYSNPMEFVAYDSKCIDCTQEHVCTQKENSCLIDEKCYNSGETKDETCQKCVPSENSTSWTSQLVKEESTCSRTCDYGAQYNNTVCSINNNLISSEEQLCLESLCPVISEEKSEGVILELTNDDITKVLLTPSSISDEIAKAVNAYCSSHAAECCNSVGASGGSTMNEFTSSNLCPIGSGYPEVGEVTGKMKIMVKVDVNIVREQCAQSASKRSTTSNEIYADSQIIYAAVVESKQNIEETLDITLLSVSTEKSAGSRLTLSTGIFAIGVIIASVVRNYDNLM